MDNRLAIFLCNRSQMLGRNGGHGTGWHPARSTSNLRLRLRLPGRVEPRICSQAATSLIPVLVTIPSPIRFGRTGV
jgi:hypothetical protein